MVREGLAREGMRKTRDGVREGKGKKGDVVREGWQEKEWTRQGMW